jgi:DNA end-binding protein Ku
VLAACIAPLLEGVSEAIVPFVSCPIALYPPISAERVSFRQVNRRTGHRFKHKLVDSVTGETIDASDKTRSYEIGENEFLLTEN